MDADHPASGVLIPSRSTVIALGPSGVGGNPFLFASKQKWDPGKTHLLAGIGVDACQMGVKTRFATAAAIVNELIEARDEKKLLRLQKTLASQERLTGRSQKPAKLLIIDALAPNAQRSFAPMGRMEAEKAQRAEWLRAALQDRRGAVLRTRLSAMLRIA